MSDGAQQSQQDLMVAHQLLAVAHRTVPAAGVVDYLMNNIRWFATALLIATGNDTKSAARLLRTLAEAMDPFNEEETRATLDRLTPKA